MKAWLVQQEATVVWKEDEKKKKEKTFSYRR